MSSDHDRDQPSPGDSQTTHNPPEETGGKPAASRADAAPAHLRPFVMHVPRYLATGPIAGAIAAGMAVLVGVTNVAAVDRAGALFGGFAAGLGLFLAAGVVRPWRGRVIAKIGPRLLAAQALGLLAVMLCGLLIYSAARPEPRSYGIVVAAGFLLGAVFQALSFKADLDAPANAPSRTDLTRDGA